VNLKDLLMSQPSNPARHVAHHVQATLQTPLRPAGTDMIRVGSRRWFLQTGLAGLAGVPLATLLQGKAQAASPRKSSVILFWLSGGPSHIDMWDPKPDAPAEIRGPFRTIASAVPGIRVCEHLPLQAKLMEKLTLIRSVDCSASNHTPITMQAGNALARRTDDNKDGAGYPSMGSVAAKFRGANHPDLPAFVGLADKWRSDAWGAGHLGSAYEPVKGMELAGRLAMPVGISVFRLQDRAALRHQFDCLQRGLDVGDTMDRMDRYGQQAVNLVLSGRARQAFRLEQEPDRIRDAYGRGSLGEKALLARRLVEAGVTYVLVSGAWGYFDHHGDDVVWGGIEKGLKPILPSVDGVVYALVNDLAERGLLETTLVLMLGEFGRGPVMTRTAGREHWVPCMSMLVAGGGLPSGQVIGCTDAKGYSIKDGRVAPADLAATVFRHLGIDLNAQWLKPQGRPIPIITEGGRPIPGLS
jgi:hypothetical protein